MGAVSANVGRGCDRIGSVGLSHAAEVRTSAGKSRFRTAMAMREKMGVGSVASMVMSSGYMMGMGLFAGRQVLSARQAHVGAGAIDAAECMTRHHHRDFSKSLKNHRGPGPSSDGLVGPATRAP